MNNDKKRIDIMDIFLLAVTIILTVGLFSFLAPCGPKEDSSWMTCHWAGQALKGTSLVMLAIALVSLLVKDVRVKMGMDIGLILVSCLSLILPGNLINLCMMADMRCRSIMLPGVRILSVIIIILACLSVMLKGREREKK